MSGNIKKVFIYRIFNEKKCFAHYEDFRSFFVLYICTCVQYYSSISALCFVRACLTEFVFNLQNCQRKKIYQKSKHHRILISETQRKLLLWSTFFVAEFLTI
jgi:uncharacterized membrane protein